MLEKWLGARWPTPERGAFVVSLMLVYLFPLLIIAMGIRIAELAAIFTGWEPRGPEAMTIFMVGLIGSTAWMFFAKYKTSRWR